MCWQRNRRLVYVFQIMKRIGNLFDKIVSIENLYLAEKKARKNKSNRKEVIEFSKNKHTLLLKLQQQLINEEYVTSKYDTFVIKEPKERLIFKLPYYPDRIVHHAIMNILEPIWVSIFVKNTYSCIKGRGIHAAVKDIKKALKDKQNTKYCLKLDIKKFYPSINHKILKKIIRRKLKDCKLLRLLDSIISSTYGVPIGNYLSQFFANLFLAYFDHWVKEVKKVKYYFRYADDITIFAGSKEELRQLFEEIKEYLANLGLQVKDNYQIFPLDSRGLSFVGYVFFHTHTRIRKNIKRSLCRTSSRLKNRSIEKYRAHICSFIGWLKYCNGLHLLRKVLVYKELLVYVLRQ